VSNARLRAELAGALSIFMQIAKKAEQKIQKNLPLHVSAKETEFDHVRLKKASRFVTSR
jgi:hypothetical protein